MSPEPPPVIQPSEWFVVFSETAATRWLGRITPGRFKHVAMFGYCAGVKVWLVYDVTWAGTRIALMDSAAVMAWSAGTAILKMPQGEARMRSSARLGLHCVNTVKQVLRLRCVAATPDQLYRHILRNGGISISDPRSAAARACRPDAGSGAAAGTEQPDQGPAAANAG